MKEKSKLKDVLRSYKNLKQKIKMGCQVTLSDSENIPKVFIKRLERRK